MQKWPELNADAFHNTFSAFMHTKIESLKRGCRRLESSKSKKAKKGEGEEIREQGVPQVSPVMFAILPLSPSNTHSSLKVKDTQATQNDDINEDINNGINALMSTSGSFLIEEGFESVPATDFESLATEVDMRTLMSSLVSSLPDRHSEGLEIAIPQGYKSFIQGEIHLEYLISLAYVTLPTYLQG